MKKKKKIKQSKKNVAESVARYISMVYRNDQMFVSFYETTRSTIVGYCTYWTPVVGILFREQKVHIHSQCSIFHLLFIVTCASCTRDRVVNAGLRIFCWQTIRNVPVSL